MVPRLVLDAVRRKWLIGAFFGFQLYLIVKMLWKFWPASNGMAWTMAGAWSLMIGANELFRTRELYQLPVSRRTWWLARWWLSITAPVAMAQLAAIFAHWSAQSQWPAVDHVVFSMAFAALYCGCALTLQTTSLGRSGDAPATSFWSGLAFASVMIGSIAAPFLAAPYLPHSLADIGTTSAIVMLAMAAFTVHGYRHTPAIEARPDMRIARRVLSAHGPGPAVVTAPAGFSDRLTGFTLVLWEECRKQLITFSTLVVLGIAAWAVASRFRTVLPLDEVLRLAGALPFTSSRAMISEPIVFGAIVAVVTVMEPGMVANIRPLRTLPISSAQLACIPAGLGLVSAAMLWIVLLALHGVLAGTLPASLRPDLFVGFAALVALAQTIRFITPGPAVGKSMLGFVPVGIVWLALAYFVDSDRTSTAAIQPTMFIGGLLILAASWVAMRQAVVRGRAIYKVQPSAVRVTG